MAQSPSFRQMVDFLHHHESHPPLFYTVVRVWTFLSGGTDTPVRVLSALLGAAIVPAAYFTGRTLFSNRAALLATFFVVFSPALNEHSTQIRPYGLMTLLVLASCSSMLLAIEGGRRSQWAIYIGTTLLLLYTHNWSWLVAFGQHAAVIVLLLRGKVRTRSVAVEWLASWLIIAVGFLPWLPAFVYQLRHAGHAGVPVNGFVNAIQLVIFGVFSSIQTLFFGRITHPTIVALAGTAAAVVCGHLSFRALRSRSLAADDDVLDGDPSRNRSARTRCMVLSVIVSATLIAAIVVTPLSNQLLGRCIATLIPLVALTTGYWIDSQWTRATAPHLTPIVGAAGLAFVMSAGVIGLFTVIVTPRSNAREAAREIRNYMMVSDLLVLAPEWFAPSFNHYFPPSIEQVDFPHTTRSGLIDFSEVWERATDSEKLAHLESRLDNASAAGRRVWLVSEVRYLGGVTTDALRQAEMQKNPAAYAILRTGQIRDLLNGLYGPPDSIGLAGASRPLYDNLKVYLYSRDASAKSSRR